ncbi:hypothetical protein BpHYR1_017824 [Brachionus plicatilis]|uniref:RNA-directed DNA polymerase from mobile element jockey-like n=1 Tax=Brachionus plicatilis TaxID=10195 RepID=A0A3M7RMS9_BRAPC|nr:hypothetical protein BpHYR1_017824 [Brachionus plicatilis]
MMRKQLRQFWSNKNRDKKKWRLVKLLGQTIKKVKIYLLMGGFGSRSALAFVDTEKDLRVTFSISWVNPQVLSSSLSQSGPARGIRGHTRRLSGQATNKFTQRADSFTNRVVNKWNTMPSSVTNSDSVRYDAFMTGHQDFTTF